MRRTAVLAKKVLLSNIKDLDYPYKLTMCLTYWCNFRCKACNIWQKKPKNEMSFKDYESFFSKHNSFSWIDLTGGEIFLRRDIKEILLLITKKCNNLYELHFPTNASMGPKVLESVNEVLKSYKGKFIVTISLDENEEKHNEVRGFPNSYKKCIELFKQLKDIEKKHRNFHVFFGFTLSIFNINDFDTMFEQLKKDVPGIKYSDVHMNIFHTSGHYYDNKDIESPGEAMIKEVKRFRKLRGAPKNPIELIEHSYLQHVPKYIETGKTPIVCEALSGSCFIDSFGDVFPCIIYGKKVGNILTDDLKEIWNKDETKILRSQIKKKQCPNCWTPCEAYQSILAHSPRLLKGLSK